jgi:hypothetical protein
MVFEPDRLVVVATIVAIVTFVFRELAAGVLRAAGQDAWGWAMRRTMKRIGSDPP